MRLEAFRVENYKKVADSGWVNVGDLTAFVGKNEAGKSALFRGLSKLNPSDKEKYDPLKEFPRRRYTDEFASRDWPVATGRFRLSAGERTELTEKCKALAKVERVEVTRHYSDKTSVTFIPTPEVGSAGPNDFVAALDSVTEAIRGLSGPEGQGEALTPLKASVLPALEQAKRSAPTSGTVTKAHVDGVINTIAAYTNEQWQQELVRPAVTPLRELAEAAATLAEIEVAKTWGVQHLPKFVYFDRYDVLETAVHIPTFVQQLSSDPNGPRVRTTNCLFAHVGLDPRRLASLGRYQPGAAQDPAMRRQVDERGILTSSASNAMTDKFRDWWEQRQHRFNYQLDGDYLRIWVSDDLDPSQIELDQRSQGLQYFFSFYVVFLVESQGAHTDSVLLLDEPGLHVHGTAQAKVVEFLGHLSEDNQTLYSTHSPFMIDADHLENARAVFEGDDGTTKVTEDVWPRDRDSLFPLQAALGYKIAQSLFISKRQVIVEGISDKWITSAVDMALEAKGRTRLRRDVVIVPSAGVSKLLPLASMLIGHGVEVAALLDGDEPGRKEGKKLVEKLLAGEDRRCLFIGDFAPGPELEDIFPVAEYLSAVEDAYPGVKVKFDAADKAMPGGIVDRVSAFFARTNAGSFEKWKIAAVLRDRVAADPAKVSDSVLDAFDAIYIKLNAMFTQGTP